MKWDKEGHIEVGAHQTGRSAGKCASELRIEIGIATYSKQRKEQKMLPLAYGKREKRIENSESVIPCSSVASAFP
jgi:hypothetical protein